MFYSTPTNKSVSNNNAPANMASTINKSTNTRQRLVRANNEVEAACPTNSTGI